MVDEETDGQTTQQEVRISNFHKSYKHQKYLELVMVFDWSRFMYLGGNFTKIVEDAILLTAIMDTYFQDVRLRICLKGLKVWSSHDRIKTFFPTLAEILGQFVLYKRLVLHHVLPADGHIYILEEVFRMLSHGPGGEHVRYTMPGPQVASLVRISLDLLLGPLMKWATVWECNTTGSIASAEVG